MSVCAAVVVFVGWLAEDVIEQEGSLVDERLQDGHFDWQHLGPLTHVRLPHTNRTHCHNHQADLGEKVDAWPPHVLKMPPNAKNNCRSCPRSKNWRGYDPTSTVGKHRKWNHWKIKIKTEKEIINTRNVTWNQHPKNHLYKTDLESKSKLENVAIANVLQREVAKSHVSPFPL